MIGHRSGAGRFCRGSSGVEQRQQLREPERCYHRAICPTAGSLMVLRPQFEEGCPRSTSPAPALAGAVSFPRRASSRCLYRPTTVSCVRFWISRRMAGSTALRETVTALADRLGIPDADREEMLPSGTQTKLYNRVGWAVTYLTKAGLLEKLGRGRFRITSRGRSVLAEQPAHIDQRYLERFDGFLAFKTTRREPDSPAPSRESTRELTQDTATPHERLDDAYKELRDALVDELLEHVRASTPRFFENLCRRPAQGDGLWRHPRLPRQRDRQERRRRRGLQGIHGHEARHRLLRDGVIGRWSHSVDNSVHAPFCPKGAWPVWLLNLSVGPVHGFALPIGRTTGTLPMRDREHFCFEIAASHPIVDERPVIAGRASAKFVAENVSTAANLQ